MPTPPTENLLDALTGSLEDATADGDATRVYLAVLRMAAPSRELLLAQGITAADLDAALAVLDARGLLSVGPSGALDVPPPLASIPQHALTLERRAKQVRAAAHELTQVYYNARTRTRDPDTGVRVLHDLDELAAQTNQIVAEARVGIKILRAMTVRTRHLLDAPLASHREPTISADGQVIAMRAVWDSRVLELTGTAAALAARAEGGEVQRFLTRVPLSLVIVDDCACVVEWSTQDQEGPCGILLRIGGMVDAAHVAFDRFWELATPLARGGVTPDLDPRDTSILRLLAAGVPDASIARQSGVSQRTVERRIRSIMDRLSAETRFQAGVQAVHRGWL